MSIEEKNILTVGAFYNKVPRSIGISLDRGPATDIIMDARDLQFHSNHFQEIFCYDMIEHVPTKDVKKVLSEFYRVLTSKGRLEVGTIDLEGICKEFISSDHVKRKALIQHFYGSQSFLSDFHKTGFDYNIIKEYLKNVRFENIKRIKPTYPWGGSLTVEAFKP